MGGNSEGDALSFAVFRIRGGKHERSRACNNLHKTLCIPMIVGPNYTRAIAYRGKKRTSGPDKALKALQAQLP